jgi:sugar fermentation stimulation protein A
MTIMAAVGFGMVSPLPRTIRLGQSSGARSRNKMQESGLKISFGAVGRAMDFETPLIPATLIRRYKRFLADARLEDGREITAHCANPGSMMGLKDEGTRIWLEPNDDPKKKLKFGWRLVEHANGHFTGVDTSVPNRALKAALLAKEIPELASYDTVRPEVKYGQNSRIDFLLTNPGVPDLYVEVKSVTLSRAAQKAEFPDSVTARGAKHLAELAEVTRQGAKAMMFYLVQRTDCDHVTLADDIDPAYAAAFDTAMAAGVDVLAYDCCISPQSVKIGRRLPFIR